MPKTLHNKLKLLGRAKTLPRVQAMSCGEQGEWFVRFWDGTWRAENVSNVLSKTIDSVHGDGLDVVELEMGSGGSWLLVYTRSS